MERPNTIIQIPKAKIAIALFLHFTQGNIGCDNHSQKRQQLGLLKTKSFWSLICLGEKMVERYGSTKRTATISRVIAPKIVLLLKNFIPSVKLLHTGSDFGFKIGFFLFVIKPAMQK
jgi:hypothetical protein